MIEREMTKKFIEEAYSGESMAHMRYQLFAEVAEKENLQNMANMFRAIAFAELVHARNHYRALGDLKGTSENLQICIDGEHYESNEMYPVFNNTAKLQGEKMAELSTHYALEAEKIHEELYAKAKELADQKRDIDAKKISICPVCGHTVVGDPPERCPICGVAKGRFIIFE
jgi:rubrerythrin